MTEQKIVEVMGVPQGKIVEKLLQNVQVIAPDAEVSVANMGLCKECGGKYKIYKSDHYFCSKRCNNRWRARKWRRKKSNPA